MNIPNDVIQDMQKEISETRKDTSETRKDVTEIKVALLGNEYNPNGLIKRQCNTEARVDKIENDIKRIFWTTAGISGGVSTIIGGIVIVLKILNKA